jgi:hypothetical protein
MKLDKEGCILRCVQLVKPLLSLGRYATAFRSNILTAGSMIATDGGRGMRCTRRRRWAREMIAGGIYGSALRPLAGSRDEAAQPASCQ